jgi:hypothetical protein
MRSSHATICAGAGGSLFPLPAAEVASRFAFSVFARTLPSVIQFLTASGGLFVQHDHTITIIDQIGELITTFVDPMWFILQKNAKLCHLDWILLAINSITASFFTRRCFLEVWTWFGSCPAAPEGAAPLLSPVCGIPGSSAIAETVALDLEALDVKEALDFKALVLQNCTL